MRVKNKKKEGSADNNHQQLEACALIRTLIVEDRLDEAMKQLQVLVEIKDTSLANEVIVLQARWNRVNKDETAGTLNWDVAQVEKNKINQALLQLLDGLDHQPTTPAAVRELSTEEKRRRAGYLRDLKADVENRLRVSIHHAPLIDLGIDDTPSATDLPWMYRDLEAKHEFNDYKEAFEAYRRRMILLGSPGSGKTITLLHIAQQLIEEAESNPAAPIPLLVNLSKFRPGNQQNSLLGFMNRRSSQTMSADKRIERWLMNEFTANPFVSADLAKTWVEEGRIAALLDGLDEVNDEFRADLVKILNATFLKQYPDAVVVVCSRINEYRPLQDRQETTVQLKGGITLQPLSNEKINDYLERAKATELRHALFKDEMLYQMAQTPLTLSMMTLAYGGLDPAKLPSNLSFTERRHHMMNAYVAKMLQRKERRDRNRQFDQNPKNDIPLDDYAYKPTTINNFLGWLAVRLSVRMQTAVSLNTLYSFLTRELDKDRQSGAWWATTIARAPLLLITAVVVGLLIAPATPLARWQVGGISLLGVILFVPVASLFRKPFDDSPPSLFYWLKTLLTIILLVIVGVITLGLAPLAISSVLPFSIPPTPLALLIICLSVPIFLYLDMGELDSNEALFSGGTLAIFLLGLGVMHFTDSKFGWYIPAVAVALLQTGVLVALVLKDEDWVIVIVVLVGIIVLVGLFLLFEKVLVHKLPWYLSFIAYICAVGMILSAASRAVILLLGLFLSFMFGAIWGGDRAALAGGLLYGYLVLVGILVIDLIRGKIYQFWFLAERCLYQVERLADRYLFTPILKQLLIMGRCLPFRLGKFFHYSEQALLLKRSAGDVEFMHRLLRDYFALRDLQPLLTSTDSNRRLQAIRSLGFQGDAAIDALTEFVRDTNPEVREAAAWALGKVVSPAVVIHIEGALADVNARVRRAAALSIRNLTDEEKVRLLKIVIDDTHPLVFRVVFETFLDLRYSLKRDFEDRILHNAINNHELRQVIFELVADSAVNRNARYNAIEMTIKFSDRNSIPYLISALSDRSFTYRWSATKALAPFYDDPRVEKALTKALSDRNKHVRSVVRDIVLQKKYGAAPKYL